MVVLGLLGCDRGTPPVGIPSWPDDSGVEDLGHLADVRPGHVAQELDGAQLELSKAGLSAEQAMKAIPGTLVVDLPPYTKDEVAEANAYLIRLGAIAPIRVKATKTDLRGGGVP